MKKITACILMLLMLGGLFLASCSKSNVKYPAGKDTVESFGDGTFQICRGDELGFFHAETGLCIFSKVETFKKIGNKVYLIGYSGKPSESSEIWHFKVYAIADVKENTIQIYTIPLQEDGKTFYISKTLLEKGVVTIIDNFSCFTQEEQNILAQLEER